MRLLSFRTEERTSFGALIEGRVVDLGRLMPEHDSLRQLLAANALVRALDTVAEESAHFRLDDVELLAPVPDAGQLLCVFDDALDSPVAVDPKFLRGPARALPIPRGEPNPLAAGPVLVIGSPGEADAGPTIAGWSLLSYLSPGALAMGPWLVTTEELEDLRDAPITAALDRNKVQFSCPDGRGVVAELAQTCELNPGDLVAALRYLPELPVAADATVEISTPDVGTLKNRIRYDDDA
jgi:2-keto-4-pentenoate hydratase/2-oxohepta-3-ene-1,7-dioic acid hydratase in catechol pathway